MPDLDEKEYHDACSRLFAEIENLLENSDADFDNNGNVIEIINSDDTTIIINKQTPMREIWLAAKSGGRHFKRVDDQWCDTRDGSTLLSQLHALLA